MATWHRQIAPRGGAQGANALKQAVSNLLGIRIDYYALGILMTVAGLLLGAIEAILRLKGNEITTPTIVLVALLLISGSQFTLFAMWFDMESNKELR